MKPTIPSVTLSVWKDLYTAAEKFHALRPWEMLDDRDLIGVRDPSGGDKGYGVVMGSGGTLFGFCLYRGAEGFDIYRRIMEGAIDDKHDDVFAMQNCVKLELTTRGEIMNEDLAIIRKLGLSFKGKHAWPEFRSHLPGYAPWFLTEAEVRFLTLGLNAACHHVERVGRGDVNGSLREGECLMYTHAGGTLTELTSQWEPWPVYTPPTAAPPILPASTRCARSN